MSTKEQLQTNRRGFLGSIATGAAALGIGTLAAPLQSYAEHNPKIYDDADPDEWISRVKGKKHRVVFDAVEPNEVMPFVWPKVFLLTNAATGTAEKDCGVIVVLRHSAIPYAFEDKLWEKYNFAEFFPKSGELGGAYQAADAATAAKTRNPMWKPKKGDFKVPGFGEVPIGINELQESGVMFCVCNAAMTVYSAIAAMKMNTDAAAVKKEWEAGLLPGIQVVPSGVWAVGRAQENGCSYVYAG